ncbi:Glyoxalase-like domain-containing protein [Parasphingorhabdus marina DSM 22363]|uniref:Glyoxalase-like domain-containing protein n=1 Tax=Parasphingorhabdus marina DSM 22363 TaxID=1123272 RepID=A0A1N6CRP2_9SPHN|nr:VOC family protein [Parasphingorhabdus marina]SIN61147.1 Glyoxalase-like domain-containing protein [Parasphingorhabdus marina DSM 22363]
MHQIILRFLLSGLVAATLLADRVEAQSPGTGTMADHPVDHILLAVPDLASGSADLGEMLSVEPTPGGEHPDLGTANSLVGLGEGIYLEIIGPASRDNRGGFAERLAKLTHPELIGFAVQTRNIEAVREAAKAAGMTTGEIRAGSRKTPDGTMLQWRTMSVIDPAHDFLVPFFIDWGGTPHPSATSVGGPQLISWEVGHPAPEDLQKIYDALGIGITIVTAPKPFLRAQIKAADRTVILFGTGGQ